MIRRASSIGPYRGGFLATTVAEGAELGPELSAGTIAQPYADNIVTLDEDGFYRCEFVNSSAGMALYPDPATLISGKRYRVIWRCYVSGLVNVRFYNGSENVFEETGFTSEDQTEFSCEFVASGAQPRALFAGFGTGEVIFGKIVSVREVIPTWRYR